MCLIQLVGNSRCVMLFQMQSYVAVFHVGKPLCSDLPWHFFEIMILRAVQEGEPG